MFNLLIIRCSRMFMVVHVLMNVNNIGVFAMPKCSLALSCCSRWYKNKKSGALAGCAFKAYPAALALNKFFA